jgi:hypothetical protein
LGACEVEIKELGIRNKVIRQHHLDSCKKAINLGEMSYMEADKAYIAQMDKHPRKKYRK